ncbi:hypothetical protein CEXT_289691 [Caerostris extrusa]|uniref:Uncharacterized protein n=1 Tax=Caerostris extrusa TaxID=172846 RepID=A0AAV4VQC3_CAEEX|nr:hypothetical protein CEXT_289691 [Caerostris extrusa]
MFGTKRKNKCGCKRTTTPRTDKFLAQNSKLHPHKTSTDRQRELLATGVRMEGLTAGGLLVDSRTKAH